MFQNDPERLTRDSGVAGLSVTVLNGDHLIAAGQQSRSHLVSRTWRSNYDVGMGTCGFSAGNR